jgi:hypothetical protein
VSLRRRVALSVAWPSAFLYLAVLLLPVADHDPQSAIWRLLRASAPQSRIHRHPEMLLPDDRLPLLARLLCWRPAPLSTCGGLVLLFPTVKVISHVMRCRVSRQRRHATRL